MGDFALATNEMTRSAVVRNKKDALAGRTVRVIADNVRFYLPNVRFEIAFSFARMFFSLFQMLPYITSNNCSQSLGGYLGDIWNIIEKVLRFR